MATTLSDIRKKMQNLDICMMTTQTGRGTFNSRPMSNNGDVKYDGNSYFFTYEGSKKIKELTANPQVHLAFSGSNDLYIAVTGKAKLIRNKKVLEKHWQESLAQWFEQGLDTPGIVLIQVKAALIKYWQREKEGVLKISSRT